MKTRYWLVVLWIALMSVARVEAAWYIGPAAGISGSAPCSDSANGARGTPFCSMGSAQTAMNGSGDKQTYFRGQPTTGTTTYNINTTFTVGSNTNWATDPLDVSRSALINFSGITGSESARGISCNGCANVSFRNLTFQPPTLPAGSTQSGHLGGESGTIFIQQTANNISIENNRFQGALQFECNDPCLSQQHLKIYNSDNLFIRGNTFVGPNPTGIGTGLNAGEAINVVLNSAGASRTGLYITDNIFDGCTRWCLELHPQNTSGTIDHWHIDRNTFSNFAGTATNCESGVNAGAISAASNITSPSVNMTNSTIWGNQINGSLTGTNCSWGAELLWDGATVSQNTFVGGSAIGLGKSTNTVIENNTFTLATSGSTHQCSPRQCQFTQDLPNADGTEWVGANTINGATVTGMSSTWSFYGTVSYGTKPTTSAPSTPFATGPTFTFTASTPVASGATSTLTWSVVTGSPTSCTASVLSGQADTAWSTAGAGPTSAQLIAGGTKSSTARTAATTYRMSCTDGINPAVDVDAPVTIIGSAPTAPGSFAVSGATVSTVSATWVASADVDGDLAGYRVYACFPSPCTRTLHMTLPIGTTGTIRGLRGGQSYSIALRGFDAGALESGDSTVQTISTSAIPGTNPELLMAFEEGTGTALFDSSGHGHNSSSFTGTFSATAHDGSFSGAFSGTQAARIPRTYSGESPVGLEPTAVTLATWVRRNGTQGLFTNLINKTYQNNTPPIYTSYKLVLNPDPLGSDVVECEVGQTGTPGSFLAVTSASGPGPITDLTWRHVACTYDPAGGTPQLRLYVSGVLVAQANSTVAIPYQTDTTGDLWLSDNGAGGERYVGLLDETQVYRRALTLAEVQALAGVTGDTTPPAAPSNLRVVSP